MTPGPMWRGEVPGAAYGVDLYGSRAALAARAAPEAEVRGLRSPQMALRAAAYALCGILPNGDPLAVRFAAARCVGPGGWGFVLQAGEG